MGTGAACVVYALFHKIKPFARRRRTRPVAAHGRSPLPRARAPNLCFHARAP